MLWLLRLKQIWMVPTHNDGRLYHLGGGGDIACIDAQSGKKLWTRNIVDEFGCRLYLRHDDRIYAYDIREK